MMRLPSPVQPDLDDIFTQQDEIEATKRESWILRLYQSSRAEVLADADYKFSDLLSVEEEDLTVDERIKKMMQKGLASRSQKKLSDVEFEKAKQAEQDRTTPSAGVPPPAQASLRCPFGHPLLYKPASDARGKGKCDCCGQPVALDDSIAFCVMLSKVDEDFDCNYYLCQKCVQAKMN